MRSLRTVLIATVMTSTFLMGQVNLDSGLVAFYPFDGAAEDFSGNNNHGIVFGAMTAPDRHGNPDAAFQFDGINDYIEVEADTAYKPQLPLSFSVWINLTAVTPNGGMMTNYADTTYNGVWFDIVNSTGELTIGFGDGGPIGPQSRRSKTSSTVLEADRWYHLVGIIRDLQDMDIYVNGLNTGGHYDGFGDSLAYNFNPMTFGKLSSSVFGNNSFFRGLLDDIRLFDRVISREEVDSLYGSVPLAVVDEPTNSVESFELHQNYPNPFNPDTQIGYRIAQSSDVKLTIYNTLGQQIKVLVNHKQPAGSYSIKWNATNQSGEKVPSGQYYYEIVINNRTAAKKMLLIR